MSSNFTSVKLGIKTQIVILLCVLLFSSCVTMPSDAGRDLAGRILQHSLAKKKAIILGSGVSPEAAEGAASAAGAIVLYCLACDADVVRGKAESARSPGPSRCVRDLMASLRAMASSGDDWEVAVAERARGQLRVALTAMRIRELAVFRGKLILSERSRLDQPFQEQIRRVFGEGVVIEYVSSGTNSCLR